MVQEPLSRARLLPKSHPIRSPPEDHHSGCSGIAKPCALAGDVVNQISLDTWPSLDWKVWDVGVELLWSETPQMKLRTVSTYLWMLSVCAKDKPDMQVIDICYRGSESGLCFGFSGSICYFHMIPDVVLAHLSS